MEIDGRTRNEEGIWGARGIMTVLNLIQHRGDYASMKVDVTHVATSAGEGPNPSF